MIKVIYAAHSEISVICACNYTSITSLAYRCGISAVVVCLGVRTS